MRRPNLTIFDYFSKKYGISKSWCAKQLDMSPPAFHYALERGLHPEEIEIIENAFRSLAMDLLEMEVPDSLKYDYKSKNSREAA